MFGVSFTELMLIGVVALIVVGPQRLPGMMATVGKWSSKMRRMLFDVRQQSGIDDILRAEGITGGINEIRALRNAVRGNVQSLTQSFTRPPTTPTTATSGAATNPQPATNSAAVSPPVAATALSVESDPYANVPYDRSREYPDEGCDAYGAIPDDLWAATQRPAKPVEPIPEPAATGGTVAEPTAAATDADPNAEPAAATESETAGIGAVDGAAESSASQAKPDADSEAGKLASEPPLPVPQAPSDTPAPTAT